MLARVAPTATTASVARLRGSYVGRKGWHDDVSYRTMPTPPTAEAERERPKPPPALYDSRGAAIHVLRANDGKWRRATVSQPDAYGGKWIIFLDGAILRVDGTAQ